MEDGNAFEETFLYPKGDPSNPLSAEELQAKFRRNVCDVITRDEAERLLARLRDRRERPTWTATLRKLGSICRTRCTRTCRACPSSPGRSSSA
jgi:2-methylcitrate dehydratase PrpD